MWRVAYPVCLLHGLGGRAFSLRPLKSYLQFHGFAEVHIVKYDCDTQPVTASVAQVSRKLRKLLGENSDVILVGQSMGGLVANELHTKGWNVKAAVYVGSPLQGARLITMIESWLPAWLSTALAKPAFRELQRWPGSTEPPHPYWTISLAWAWSSFDGCVFEEETKLNPERHTKMNFSDHRLAFLSPWVFHEVREQLYAQLHAP